MNSGRENRISSPLGFLRSASSMVNLSLQWYACVLSPLFDHLILRDKARCLTSGSLSLFLFFCSAKLTSAASLDIANLAGTLTKLQITRCPKLRDVARLTGLKRLVELGIYECPDVVGMLIVSELPRLTHLSIDLSRATRAHLGFRCVAFSLTATHRLTMGILKDADSIALWLISDQGQWPKSYSCSSIRGGRGWRRGWRGQ